MKRGNGEEYSTVNVGRVSEALHELQLELEPQNPVVGFLVRRRLHARARGGLGVGHGGSIRRTPPLKQSIRLRPDLHSTEDQQ